MATVSNSLLINSASSEETFTGNYVVVMHWYVVAMHNPTRDSDTIHNNYNEVHYETILLTITSIG